MATILTFKIPNKPKKELLINNRVVSTSVDDVMLMIHHALHGTDKAYCQKNRELATQLIAELAEHMHNNGDDHLVLSAVTSCIIVERYPEAQRALR